MPRSDRAAARPAEVCAPRFEYRRADPLDSSAEDALLQIHFGVGARVGAPAQDAPGVVHLALEPLSGADLCEVWPAHGPVVRGREDAVRYSADGEHLAGVVELDERDWGGIAGAAQRAYQLIGHFHAASGYPYVLRIWNYFDGINQGVGDAERYKQFCIGRAAGLAWPPGNGHPAASAIGRRDGDPRLQVYWLAGRRAGVALENPRQIAAYRYPRQYGPQAPRFSRAMLTSGPTLMVSGTASIVGHASCHRDDLRAQLRETFENLASLHQLALRTSVGLGADLGAGTLLKIYLRDGRALPQLDALLAQHLPAGCRTLVLAADICRTELLIEIDCVQGP